MNRGRTLALLSLVPLAALACGDDDQVTIADGGVLDAGPPPTVTVRTSAPATTFSLPGPNNASFALALGADGTWTPIEPKELGVYAVPLRGDRWTALFACGDRDDAHIIIHDRAATVREEAIELARPCALPNLDVGDITGTFSNAPATTSWFDFGYLVNQRGSVLPLNGTNADFELLNIVQGSWDFVFGFRDDSAGPLTKVLLRRDERIELTTTVDADLATAAITPGSRALTITGATPDEQLRAPTIYAVGGGSYGIDMGPQLVAGPNLTYATVPAEQQRPTDRYRLALTASAPDDTTQRGANAVFHDAVDVTIDLPPAMPAPVFTTIGTEPLRFSMKTVGRANAATYELEAVTVVTDVNARRWTYSTDAVVAEGAEVGFDMPDLSAIPGWKSNAWSILPDRTTVTATVREMTAPLADGTMERFASHTAKFTPP